ncbi:MAG: NADH-quinone oxidoreductase subunit C [Proteobacteria bacterium]|jgi:NADH-quinone oxidoreductase subunit C|nr:NADH-quinone oxidoreductase subunit C [Pseudomonadota bacterium]
MNTDALVDLKATIEFKCNDAVLSANIKNGELTVLISSGSLLTFSDFLKSDQACKFSTLVDITAVDYPDREKRFELVYHYLSMYQNQRIRVKMEVGEEDVIPSLVGIFPASNWFEREVFDMFGLIFSGHPDLRRILTDYGFKGHPLRKDFPTSGYVEVRYDEEKKQVVYEPISLVQEYRQFDFMSPWEGAEYILPNEKDSKDSKV